MNIHRRRIGLALAGATILSACGLVHAQSFPQRPIRLIVPYAAGGGTDVLAREIARHASNSLGQPIIIENSPAPARRSLPAKWHGPLPTGTRCCGGTTPPLR